MTNSRRRFPLEDPDGPGGEQQVFAPGLEEKPTGERVGPASELKERTAERNEFKELASALDRLRSGRYDSADRSRVGEPQALHWALGQSLFFQDPSGRLCIEVKDDTEQPNDLLNATLGAMLLAGRPKSDLNVLDLGLLEPVSAKRCERHEDDWSRLPDGRKC